MKKWNSRRKQIRFGMWVVFLIGASWGWAMCGDELDRVAEYTFSEGEGAFTTNTGTDDFAGDLLLLNGVQFHADTPLGHGGCGWSVSLPDSGSGMNTPVLESEEIYDPLADVDHFTMMAWVRRTSTSNKSNHSARIISSVNSLTLTNTTAGVEFRFSGSAGGLALRINGYEVSATTVEIPPDDNAWHHVAVVYDGRRPATSLLTRNVHFYVDGIQKGNGNILQGEYVNASSNVFTLGNSAVNRSVANTLVGQMDDVILLAEVAPAAVGNGMTNEVIRCYMTRNDDTQPPTIFAPPDIGACLLEGESTATDLALGWPAISDNCSVDKVENDAPSEYPLGTTWVTWTVWDRAGNSATAVQRVYIFLNQTVDSDGDGLSDWEEWTIYHSDPQAFSTAGDGISDGWKVQYGLNPSLPLSEECRPRCW